MLTNLSLGQLIFNLANYKVNINREAGSSRRSPKLSCAIFIFLIIVSTSVFSAEIKEQHIQASFLYNLPRYITWPHRASFGPENPVQYCVSGVNETVELLAETISNKPHHQKRIILKHINELNELEGCEFLIITSKSSIPIKDIFREVKGKPIITAASNVQNFAKRGGMIYLSSKNKRLHVIINADVVEESNLKISSKVTRLSTILTKK